MEEWHVSPRISLNRKPQEMLKLVFGIVLFLVSSAVQAADGAKFRAIGFSADNKYFAFEQYGVQDGSGFAYVDIFVIDIPADKWVTGTPIKLLLEDETMSVTAVREKAKKQSSGLLKSLKISGDAEFLASNPFGEIVADRSKVTFHDHYNNGMGLAGNADDQGSWGLNVTTVDVPLPDGCEDDIGVKGFKLELINHKSKASAVLHLDKNLPKSRFCTVGYDVEAIVQPVGGSEAGQMIAVIGVYSRGFEGSDRRFIAIPFKLN
jgi:predicted secreted protein